MTHSVTGDTKQRLKTTIKHCDHLPTIQAPAGWCLRSSRADAFEIGQ